MKKMSMLAGAFFAFVVPFAFAQDMMPVARIEVPSPPVNWTSKNSGEEVTINNGTGNQITITITVDRHAEVNNANTTSAVTTNAPPGINIKNCGRTTHIDAGSSVICSTKDAGNPVSFSSDSPSLPATGTYTIKEKS